MPPPPQLVLQAHFPRGKWDRNYHLRISGVYFEFQITSFNGKRSMGPRDQYIYTTGMGGGPNANVELLLAAKGNLPDEPWSSDDKPPPGPTPRRLSNHHAAFGLPVDNNNGSKGRGVSV